jgi:hypothetical protein
MDRHIEELASRMGGKGNAAGDVFFRVLAVGTEQDRFPDFPGTHFGMGVLVGFVKAAHKAQHKHQVRMGFHGLFRGFALPYGNAQGFLRKYVLPGVQRLGYLFGVQRRRGNQDHRVHFLAGNQFLKGGKPALHAETIRRLIQFRRIHIAEGRKFRVPHPESDVFRMLQSKTAQTYGANTYFVHNKFLFVFVITLTEHDASAQS